MCEGRQETRNLSSQHSPGRHSEEALFVFSFAWESVIIWIRGGTQSPTCHPLVPTSLPCKGFIFHLDPITGLVKECGGYRWKGGYFFYPLGLWQSGGGSPHGWWTQVLHSESRRKGREWGGISPCWGVYRQLNVGFYQQHSAELLWHIYFLNLPQWWVC